jgi:cbb3-type cytochrome c oxidase subunit III
LSVRLAVAAAALAALLAGCGSEGRVSQPGNTARGKQLFQESCGQCHELADAGTAGTIGPNLDDAFDDVRVPEKEGGPGFQESTIRDLVRGQIAYPVENPPTGQPGMPANIVTGDDADAVASYVASVAGLPVSGGGGGGIEATSGQEIFAAAGCGSCHTLAAAGTNGTIGPNLDQAKPDHALVVDRVTNGKGVMPSFSGRLSAEQIQAVADYVTQSAGR